ncbi:MAG: type II secretion system protein GspG [Candidatus Hinthialibacter antarcticus]|nr:type II secretion system protein GspG [Candidatus Hinthialibacter antarcticus]
MRPLAVVFLFPVIIALALACGGPSDSPAVQSHRIVVAGQEVDFKMQMMLILAASEIYRIHVGKYPSTQNGLDALIAEPEILEGTGIWRGPYIDNPDFFKDPWGRPLAYSVLESGVIELRSDGADGKPGGDDLDAKKLFPNWYKEIHALANMPAPYKPTPPKFD